MDGGTSSCPTTVTAAHLSRGLSTHSPGRHGGPRCSAPLESRSSHYLWLFADYCGKRPRHGPQPTHASFSLSAGLPTARRRSRALIGRHRGARQIGTSITGCTAGRWCSLRVWRATSFCSISGTPLANASYTATSARHHPNVMRNDPEDVHCHRLDAAAAETSADSPFAGECSGRAPVPTLLPKQAIRANFLLAGVRVPQLCSCGLVRGIRMKRAHVHASAKAGEHKCPCGHACR